MFFIINRTRRKVCKDDTRTVRPCKDKEWPTVTELGDFVESGDTLELIEIDTKQKAYYGVPYIQQQPYTYGMERVNKEGTGYVTVAEKAQQFLAEQITPTGIILPHPRCGCGAKAENPSDMQSLADTGKCWECRTPSRDVIVPRPKKE